MKALKTPLLALLAICSMTAHAGVAKRTVRILFIGNSAIYFHNLPQIVSSIANSGPDPIEVQTELIAEGGQTLEGHWSKGDAQREIRAKPWDYVVLQEQSGLNDELRVNGVWQISGWESYHRFAKLFDSEIKAVGAKTILMSLWRHQNTPPREQQVLDYATAQLAEETGALLVPAGAVWQAVEKADPGLKLYNDSFHPTPIASYIFAATFYSSVFKKELEPLSTKVVGPDIDIEDKLGSDAHAVIVDVPGDKAAEIKRIVSEVARRRISVPKVPANIELPALPKGAPLTKERLFGKWEGTETLFTTEPMPFSLTLSDGSEGVSAATHLALQDEAIDEKDVPATIDETLLTLDNQKALKGSRFRYRAVLVGDELIGTTEVWLNKQLIDIGIWKAKRRP